jgi:hypothetical protein
MSKALDPEHTPANAAVANAVAVAAAAAEAAMSAAAAETTTAPAAATAHAPAAPAAAPPCVAPPCAAPPCAAATAQQTCYAVVDDLLCKFGHIENDVAKVMEQRVPAFVERTLRAMEERDVHRMAVENCVGRIYATNQSKYMHNAHNNGYYRVDDDEQIIRLVPSDAILLELAECIPAELLEHRTSIMRSLKALVRKQCIFQWEPASCLVDNVRERLALLFGGSRKRANAFMYVLGAILLKDEAAFDQKVHLWHGPCAAAAVEAFQCMISQITQSYSPLWNRLKSRMHHSYFPLAAVSMLYFDVPREAGGWDTFYKTLHGMRESIVVACCQLHRDAAHGASHRTPELFHHPYTDAESVWLAYCGAASKKLVFVHMDEILKDFRFFCGAKCLPANLLTPTEIRRFADNLFVSVRHRMNAPTLYHAALTIPTFYEHFDLFCSEILVVPAASANDVEGISSGRLYNTFDAWTLQLEPPTDAHIVGANDDDDGDATPAAHSHSGASPAQQKYPYNMFDAFLHQRFMSTSDGKWRVCAYANADMLRYYKTGHQQALKAHLQKTVESLLDDGSDGAATAAATTPTTAVTAAEFQPFELWCLAKYGAFSLHPESTEKEGGESV